MSIEVHWKGAGSDTVRHLLGDKLSNDGDLILEVNNATLNCRPEELAILLTTLSNKEFDMVELSDLSSVAVLHRRKKVGGPILLVKPAPFKRSPMVVANRRNSECRELIKRQKGSGTRGILAAAFAFFVIVVIGVLFYKSRSRAGRARS